MPFKSKSQQRFMFAAEARGELPKGTAKRWADHTPNIKSLPEKKQKKEANLKLAFLLGRVRAFEESGLAKEAGLESLIGGSLRASSRLWAPAATGAVLAGPDYRTEGALAGLGLGALGMHAGRRFLRNMKFEPKDLEALKPFEDLRPGTRAFEAFEKAQPELSGKYKDYLANLNNAEWAGRLGGGAAAGYAIPRLAAPPSGGGNSPQQLSAQQLAPAQFYAPQLPAVNDISGHYSGLLPEGVAY